MGEEKYMQGLVDKPEQRGQPGESRHTWKDNIKMDLTEIGWEFRDQGDVAQEKDKLQAVLNMVINICVP